MSPVYASHGRRRPRLGAAPRSQERRAGARRPGADPAAALGRGGGARRSRGSLQRKPLPPHRPGSRACPRRAARLDRSALGGRPASSSLTSPGRSRGTSTASPRSALQPIASRRDRGSRTLSEIEAAFTAWNGKLDDSGRRRPRRRDGIAARPTPSRRAQAGRALEYPSGETRRWRHDHEDVPELHRRRVGRRRLRRDVRLDEPRRRRADRHVPEVRRRGRRARGRGGEGRVRGLAPRPRAEARRDPLPLRAAARRATRTS